MILSHNKEVFFLMVYFLPNNYNMQVDRTDIDYSGVLPKLTLLLTTHTYKAFCL